MGCVIVVAFTALVTLLWGMAWWLGVIAIAIELLVLANIA
jgi:hypothetical protein